MVLVVFGLLVRAFVVLVAGAEEPFGSEALPLALVGRVVAFGCAFTLAKLWDSLPRTCSSLKTPLLSVLVPR